MSDFDPVSQLETLLGPKPSHPWEALIPQILLWSFRRFCIAKLCKTSETLTEQIWDNHMELIESYAPKGLEEAASIWLTPDNIDLVHSSLDDYNYFFLSVLVMIDGALLNSDEEAEDIMATFLDREMSTTIYNWIQEKEFLIFPMENDDDDVFTDEQYMRLLTNLTEFIKNNPEQEQEPEPEPEQEQEPEAPVDPPELRIELCGEVCTGVPPPPPPAEEVIIIKSAKDAFNYRRTFRNRAAARRNTKKRMFA